MLALMGEFMNREGGLAMKKLCTRCNHEIDRGVVCSVCYAATGHSFFTEKELENWAKTAQEKILFLARVPYGDKNVDPKNREYKVEGLPTSPVGRVDEWVEYAAGHLFKALQIRELDGNVTIVPVEA